MDKTLERADSRIQKICDALRYETLQPAKDEAARIIEGAKLQAAEIIKEGEKHVESLLATNKKAIEKERNVFNSTLEQASKQSLEELKQMIEHKLFNTELDHLLSKELTHPQIISQLISSLIQAIQKDGLSTDFSALIPKMASAEEINQLIGKTVLEKVKEGTVVVGDFGGGAKLKLNDKKMTIDVSDSALKELFSRYLRKDFRNLLFGKLD
jgi:V/A-type H+-transporting ATPase subunit E